MLDPEGKKRLRVFIRAGLPYTIVGMVVVFGGLWAIRVLLAGNEYQGTILFVWLAIFWFVYQPLFRRRILRVKRQLDNK